MSTVLITGTNRGIGLALVTIFTRLGWTVHATVRDLESAKPIKELGNRLYLHKLDVKDHTAMQALSVELKDELIDVLIANAGIFNDKETTGNLNPHTWLETLHVNAIAPVLLAEAFIEQVGRSEHKKMIAISSSLGSIMDNENGGLMAYRTSKAALNSAWRTLAHDVKPRKIIATAIDPGWVKTDMGGGQAQLFPEESAEGIADVIEKLELKHSGRFLDYKNKHCNW